MDNTSLNQENANSFEWEALNQKLARFGGYTLLETAIDGAKNMNPEREARKNIFLEDAEKKTEREKLKKTLALWEEMLSNDGELSEIASQCDEKLKQGEQELRKNLGAAVQRTRKLESSYRNLTLFFRNTEQEKLKNFSVMNASNEQLKDLDNPTFIDTVHQEFKDNFDKLSMKDNYSILVLPGYLGSNAIVDKWARLAHENKVMMVTDFAHFDQPDDVMEEFDRANLTGADAYKSNVIMACNWLVGRGKTPEIGENGDLHVAPSGALAGKIYSTLMSQVSAGKKYGALNEVEAVRFDLRRSEITELEKLGLVPMVNEYGKVMAFSAKTLFNGDNLGLQTYSVVRVFDYVTKVLMDFLNRCTFQNFNNKMRNDLLKQIVGFMDGITGHNKLIEKYEVKRFAQDPKQKDKVHLDIHMRPYFPAKNFMIRLDGQNGEDGTDWDSNYEEA